MPCFSGRAAGRRNTQPLLQCSSMFFFCLNPPRGRRPGELHRERRRPRGRSTFTGRNARPMGRRSSRRRPAYSLQISKPDFDVADRGTAMNQSVFEDSSAAILAPSLQRMQRSSFWAQSGQYFAPHSPQDVTISPTIFSPQSSQNIDLIPWLLLQSKRGTITSDQTCYFPQFERSVFVLSNQKCAYCGHDLRKDSEDTFDEYQLACRNWDCRVEFCSRCTKLIDSEKLKKCPKCGATFAENSPPNPPSECENSTKSP